MKKILFPLFFLIVITLASFWAISVMAAAGIGQDCTSDSQCSSGDCAMKMSPHYAGVCMPATITSDITININHSETTGYAQYKSSNGQSYFNNCKPSANWVLLQWNDWFCEQGKKVYRCSEGDQYYYKSTDGTKYWYMEREGMEAPALNVLHDLICKTKEATPSSYCGDGTCDSGETCSNCPSDCGVCKKSDGSSCSYASECSGGYCVHGICRSDIVYCGDGYCDAVINGDSETCSNCPSDCGVCEVTKKAAGEFCNENKECKSGNCRNYRCCIEGKECCFSHNHCGLDEYCSSFYHFCVPAKPLGQKCTEDEECLSNNCGDEVKICCEYGQVCCKSYSDCRENEYCEQGTFYCRYKWQIGEACGDYGSAMCDSGYCDPETWKCAEKPPEEEKPVFPEEKKEEPAPAKLDIVLSLPGATSLKKGQEFTPVITIENKSQKEIVLGEELRIENPIPASIETNQTILRIYKIKLLPGEKVSTAAKNRLESIEALTLTGKSQGAGEIKVKVIYFVEDQPATWLEESLPIEVSWEHIQREETATAIFGKEMILDEEKEGYIFVEPEDSKDYRANTNYWQEAQIKVKKHLDKLEDDFRGMVEPEIISFFRTVKELEEAKSAEEITETAIRAIAPPIIMGTIDFANLLDALEERKKERKKEEQAFLEYFGATEFVVIDSVKAIIREGEGKKYAIKIGDL